MASLFSRASPAANATFQNWTGGLVNGVANGVANRVASGSAPTPAAPSGWSGIAQTAGQRIIAQRQQQDPAIATRAGRTIASGYGGAKLGG